MKQSIFFLSRLRRFLTQLGPGLITGASDDDPSGIATYSQAGAGFGLTTLWTALLTFPLMAAIQEMCARIGLITAHGLMGCLKTHYPRPLAYLMLVFSLPAIVLNIGADIQGMGAVANLLVPQVPVFVFSLAFTAGLLFVIIRFSYQQLVLVLKWLCLSLLLYLVVPFLVHTNWPEVLRNTFIPTLRFDSDFLQILVAILGTTISPYLFFWQATMEAEDQQLRNNLLSKPHDMETRLPEHFRVNAGLLRRMKADVFSGMGFSNLIMFFIILTAGTVLFEKGGQMETIGDVAKALEPLAGRFAYLLFALGVIGTGLLAIPVLAGSLSYILAETFGWTQGLDKKLSEAKGFYISIVLSLVVGLSLEGLGISPVKALFYTAILYGLTAPVMIAMVLHICNNPRIMGQYTNGRLSNGLGIVALLLMSTAALLLLFQLWS